MTPSTDSDEESSPSPQPIARDAHSVPAAVVSEEQVTYPLPTRWSDQARSPSLSVSHDGREISHHGANSNNEKDHAANARANHHVPPACGIFYYEVEVKSKEQKSHISIGFGSHTVKFTRLPGWEKESWGYFGDDGHVYENGRGGGVAYAQPFGSGDFIGCGIDFTNHKIFYTKNQAYLGYVFDDVGKNGELYPIVGLRHPGDSVRVNLGHEPFHFDIEDHVQQQRNATWTTIMKTPLDSTLLHRRYHKNAIKSLLTNSEPPSALTEDESKSVLNQLVLSYLIHHGYAKTARAFHKQQNGNGKIPENSDVDMDCRPERAEPDDFEGDIERRTGIVNSVINGDIDTALEDTRKHYPAVLDADDGLILFKLRCRKLVELILETNEIRRRMSNGKEREGSPIDLGPSLSSTNKFISRPPTTADLETALTRAIEYGQSFSDYKTEKRPELRQMFEQASSVIAWHDPLEAGGPTAEVAGPEARIALANEVNEAILKSQGRPVRPTLEMVYRHTSACMTQLGVNGVGSAVFADMSRELLET
ncbi:Ran-binding protein 10 [Leucoagaricus sp. SymC.cos]|nr:Ran-binding protein 10 [Leucoagaricus sp. SymC.cos]